MADASVGFVGLGQMGGPMAANIAKAGYEPLVYDKAGTKERAPEGAVVCDSLEAVLAADIVFLSVPDGPVSIALAKEIADAPGRATKVVVDLSTIGPAAAREAGGILQAAGVAYCDAPVSGGQAGARAGTITIMFAGPKHVLEDNKALLDSFSGNVFHVGDAPGQGQAVKILNNFLSGTAMAATTEAVLYGLSQGIDMKTILDVVNVSTGQNTATADKFPKRILTETFDAGFKTKLLSKDVSLFLKNAEEAGTPHEIGSLLADIWSRVDKARPDSDFTLVYQYLRDGK